MLKPIYIKVSEHQPNRMHMICFFGNLTQKGENIHVKKNKEKRISSMETMFPMYMEHNNGYSDNNSSKTYIIINVDLKYKGWIIWFDRYHLQILETKDNLNKHEDKND